MKTTFNKSLKAFTLCAGFFSLVACREKSVTKPGRLIPSVDNIHTFGLDASFFTPNLAVIQYDSLITNDSTYFYAGIGKISDDPFFGSSESGLYVQFIPSISFTQFPTDVVVDSASICLPYVSNVYGDTSKTTSNIINLNVYRVTDDAFKRGTGLPYYAFTSFTTNPTPIGGGSFDYKSVFDTIRTAVDTFAGQMRIPLNQSFINELVTADSSKYASTDAFLAFVKGFYIAPSASSALQRRVSYVSLNGTTTNTTARIEFYVHNTTSGAYRKITFPFNYTNCAFSNRIIRGRNGTPSQKYEGSTNATVRDSVIIQGYPGYYSEITIKNIDQIPPSIINKAQLRLTCLPLGLDNYYTGPTQLVPMGVNPDGTRYTLSDLLTNGGSPSANGYTFVDGKPREVTINGTKYIQYAINFPRELQLARDAGKKELKLRISSSTATIGAFRMVAGGLNGAADTKLHLEVIYTKTN